MGGVDVEIIVAVAHHMLCAAARTGPSNHVGHLMGGAERPIHVESPHLKDRDPARPIQILCWWAAARPSPILFSEDRTRPGPTRPLHFFKHSRPSARPDPVHQNLQTPLPGPTRLITFSKPSARPGFMATFRSPRPVTSPE